MATEYKKRDQNSFSRYFPPFPNPKEPMKTDFTNDEDDWPPFDPTDEELEALSKNLEEEPEDLPDEAPDIPFPDIDAEEINSEMP